MLGYGQELGEIGRQKKNPPISEDLTVVSGCDTLRGVLLAYRADGVIPENRGRELGGLGERFKAEDVDE